MSVDNRRCLLHRVDKDEFERFLIHEGYILKELDGFKVIKAQHGRNKEWFFAYDGKSPEHLSVESKMQKIVRKYIAWKNGEIRI